MPEIHVIGVPFNGDGTPPEVENPPARLREAGLLERLVLSRRVRDGGELPIPAAEGVRDLDNGVLNWSAWRAVTEGVQAAVGDALDDGGWPLVIGGDCGILVGCMAAAVRAVGRCGLFFVDGHADYHTPETSPAGGEPADLELASLTGRAPDPAGWPEPLVRDDDVVVFGIRDYDGIGATPIRVIDHARLVDADVAYGSAEAGPDGIAADGGGLAAMVEDGAAALDGRPAWLHFDVDVVDPGLMPVLIPAGPGLTFEQTRTVLHGLLRAGVVVGMSVACFHPNLDRDGSATAALVDLLVDVLSAGV